MDAFSPIPPEWTKTATRSLGFCCPRCHASPMEAQQVWINRHSPVYTPNHRRKWQEFYHCQCQYSWWGWSSDRPPSEFSSSSKESSPSEHDLEHLLQELFDESIDDENPSF